MERFYYRNDSLYCEDVALDVVARDLGTPVYVYSSQSVVDHCDWIEKSFGEVPHLSCYAVKANSNPQLLKIIVRQNLGADVGSLGELSIALDAGFPQSKITMSGVGKNDDEIVAGIRENIIAFIIESEEEIRNIDRIALELGKKARVLMRLNFDIDAGAHPCTSTGHRQAKFGLSPSDAMILARQVRDLKAIEIVGIHSHIGSQITDEPAFIRAAEALVAFGQEVQKLGIRLEQINFGGGFGVQYKDYLPHPKLPVEPSHSENSVTTVKLLQSVLPILKKAGCMIVIQPGRSVIAHAGVLLTKVLYRKVAGKKTFIIVDAGMNDLLRPSLYQSYHQIVPLSVKGGRHEVVDIVGPLCESGDYLALDRTMPVMQRGDYLAVMCTGAYGFVLSSNYNGRARPAEVLVDGRSFTVITPRESLNHIFAKGMNEPS
jgi:diaminopimelate decarboxylase